MKNYITIPDTRTNDLINLCTLKADNSYIILREKNQWVQIAQYSAEHKGIKISWIINEMLEDKNWIYQEMKG